MPAAERTPAGQGTTAPRLRHPSVNPWVLAGAAVLIAAAWIYAVVSIRADHLHTLEEERGALRTVTAGLEMQVESMLNDGIGAALAGANVVEQSGELGDLKSARTAEMLADMLTGGDYVRSLFISSRTSFTRVGRGNVRLHGAPPDWLSALISRSGDTQSMVGLRMVDPERPEHYVIPVVRRLDSQEAWAGGLFDFHEVNDLYRRSVAASSALLLLGEEGSTLVRVPNRAAVGVISVKITESGVFAHRAPAAGFIESAGSAGHAPVFVAFQRVRGYPMFAASGTSLEEVLAPWQARRRNTLAFTAVATLAIAAMTWMLNHYVTALWRRDVEYRALFNNAGFSAFTLEGERFRDANRTTLSMFGLPDVQAARGLINPTSFSRTRPR